MPRERVGTLYGFANRLDELIKKNGYSYNDIAKRVGKDRKTVYRWKDGEIIPDGIMIVRLSQILHTTPNYLLLGK